MEGAAIGPLTWDLFLRSTEVYALTLPERAEHIEGLLRKWRFTDSIIFYGMLKETIRLTEWAKQGRIEQNDNVTEGRVACHFGHRGIMEEFLEFAPDWKKWLLIFEDDLLDSPADELQRDLLDFLSEVPLDFDILHLGFLWETRDGRDQVSERVFRTKMAVGRHAYMVTRRGARTLLEATEPQRDAGDEMYCRAIRELGLAAYQPEEPLFRQDRDKFVSKILMYRRPARDFRPSEEALQKWQAEAVASRTHFKDLTEERKLELSTVAPETLRALEAKIEDRKANPKVDLREPLLLVGGANRWSPEEALKRHAFEVVREHRETDLLGTWCHDGDKTFQISRTERGELRAAVPLAPGHEAAGPLQVRGKWIEGPISVAGMELGSIRLQFDKGRGTSIAGFKWQGEVEWSADAPAHKLDDGDDDLQVEHHLTVYLPAGSLDFQLISARRLWSWRMFPAKSAAQMLLRCGDRTSVPAAITVDKDDGAHNGRNFCIRERQPGRYIIKVLLKRRGRMVWYERAPVSGPDPACPPEASAPPATESRPDFLVDLVEPLRIVGDFNDWDVGADRCELEPQPCTPDGEWREHRLPLLLEDGRLDFQVVSSDLGFRWRCYPEICKDGVHVLRPDANGVLARIGGEAAKRASKYSVQGPKKSTVVVSVWLRAEAPWPGSDPSCTEARVACRQLCPGEQPVAFSTQAHFNFPVARLQALRLVGDCVKWNARAAGLEFAAQPCKPSSAWQEHRLCCQLQGDHVDFQVISTALGFRWRCFPRDASRGSPRMLPPGESNDVAAAVGGDGDGHGCNFRIQETAFARITISAWLRVREGRSASADSRCQQVMVTYRVEDTGVTVGIGPSHTQFPLRRRCAKAKAAG